jgi:serine/threonine protein kinase
VPFEGLLPVSLLQQDSEQKLYAMKTLRKRDVIELDQAAHVKAERDILAEANSEWIVKLYCSFQVGESKPDCVYANFSALRTPTHSSSSWST